MKNVMKLHMNKFFDSRTVKFGVWQLKLVLSNLNPKDLKTLSPEP